MDKQKTNSKPAEIEIKSKSRNEFFLIHGYTGSTSDFNKLPIKLNKSFNANVRVPLLIGHGTHVSDLDNYSFNDYLMQVEEELKKGINKKKIFITGIPVDDKFLKKINKSFAKKKLGFNSKLLLITIIWGGTGIGNLKHVVECLDSFSRNVQIAIITGINKELYLELLKMHFNNKVKIFGFVRNIDEFMSASDFIIGKAGGSLLSESLTKKVPTIIYGNLSAQERLNANFINSRKLGYFVLNDKAFKRIIKKIINNPKVLNKLKENMVNYSMDYALEDVLKVIIKT